MSKVAYPALFDNDILVTTSIGTWVPVSGPASVISLVMIPHNKRMEFFDKITEIYQHYTKPDFTKLAVSTLSPSKIPEDSALN